LVPQSERQPDVREGASSWHPRVEFPLSPRRSSGCPCPGPRGSIDGLDLARRLRERREPVVLITGYSAAAGSAAAEGFPVLRKPFTMAARTAGLAQALRRLG
jgi:CheY-like chemotaxis protein